jgi:hypothetical protein
MSWPELERLVTEAEASQELQWSLRRCRYREELLLAAWRLGYHVRRIDLQNTWLSINSSGRVFTARLSQLSLQRTKDEMPYIMQASTRGAHGGSGSDRCLGQSH